jgi:hypothetical protein
MSNTSTELPPLDQACCLVGRFFYYFARVEQKIDQAVIKLSDLDEKVAPVVASLDSGRKVELVRGSARAQLTEAKDRQFATDTCNKVHELNMDRRMIAHSSFEPAAGGSIQFSRIITREGKIINIAEPWSATNFSERFRDMEALIRELDRLILLIKPLPPFGWFNSWQETYHRSSSAAVLAATSGATQWPPSPPRQGVSKQIR